MMDSGFVGRSLITANTWKLGRCFAQRKRLIYLQTADCREVFTKHHQQRAALIIIVDIPLVAVEREFHILSYLSSTGLFCAEVTLLHWSMMKETVILLVDRRR